MKMMSLLTMVWISLCFVVALIHRPTSSTADGGNDIISPILNGGVSMVNNYGKWGFGPCPKYPTMGANFNVSRIYGGKWYVLADYSEQHSADRHCTEVEYSDANQGADVCRIKASRTALEFDGELRPWVFFNMLPNITDPSSWVEDYHGVTSKVFMLSTDYKDFWLQYKCTEFPRDNPLFYEEHHMIMSRTAIWPDDSPLRKKLLDWYKSIGVDIRFFVFRDQKDCGRAVEMAQAYN